MIRFCVIFLLATDLSSSLASNINSFKYVSNSELGKFKKAAVVTNGPECAQIGSDILKFKDGSAVDAAIAVLICEGVASLHSMGLGGGFLMTIYDAKTQTPTFLNARETAPGHASPTMFQGNAHKAVKGGLSVAVPGELLGYWEAHQKYGRVPWRELFEPAIKLCKTGSIITNYLDNYLKMFEKEIRSSPTLVDILVDPKTKKLLTVGDRIKRPQLAKTLRQLADAKNPVELFYRGRIANQLVEEIKSFGGIITHKDFANYKVKWTSPIKAKIGDMTMYTAPSPGSGMLLVLMLNVLKGLVPAKHDVTLWQRFVETFKWAYGERTKLADPDFVNISDLVAKLTSKHYADHIRSQIKDDKTYLDPRHYGAETENTHDGGTGHISVLAPDGSAVSVTSTINQIFGADIRSRSTGIIFNDEMDDFSAPGFASSFGLPPSPNNFIRPHKRPFSSMVPTIGVNKHGKVELVIGAAGGTKITTSVATTIALHLWNNFNIKEAIDAHRLHHQLLPMKIYRENGFPQEILDSLKKIGHDYDSFQGIGSAVTAISVKHGTITANSDYRRQGKSAGF